MSDLSAKKRRELKESDFGIPEKRLYPMIDAEDVTSAVSLFGKASPKYRKTLAERILSKAKEFNVDSSGWKTIIQCAQEQVPPMSDGTSLGNAPALTIDPFNESDELLDRVNGKIAESGSFSKYKKTDLSDNRGPIIAQEQTLYGIGAYTGDEEHKIPVECPDNMTDDEKLLYQIIFDNHGDFDIINTIIERIVAPLCDKLGLKENAMTALMKYRHVDNEEDLWDVGFEHSDYVWGYLYPAVKGMIKSDHIAHITFDTDCSYIENPERKRPVGYKQIVVEVELTKDGVINTHVISPTKTESQKLLSFDIVEYRDLVNMRASRDTFEKMCVDKIDAILPSDLKKFIKNSDETYYSYPAKYFAALTMLESIWDISRIYIRDEFNHDQRVKKLNHNDWQKKMEILDDVLKDANIPIGFSDDYGDLFILYKTSTGEILESFHGQVLAKSWKEFESKLKKTNLRDQHVQEAAPAMAVESYAEPIQEGLFSTIGQKIRNSRLASIEKQTGPLPSDLSKYLSAGYTDYRKTQMKFMFRMIRIGEKTIVVKYAYSSKKISTMNTLHEFIPLFDCFNDCMIGYDPGKIEYTLIENNHSTKIMSSFTELANMFKLPENDDVDYIETVIGTSLPEEFKKVFLGKKYQELIDNCDELQDIDDPEYTTSYQFCGPYEIGEWTRYAAESHDANHGEIAFGVVQYDATLIYYNNKVYIDDTRGEPEYDGTFEEFIDFMYTRYKNESGKSVQEGAFQDIKNGVNPKSKKLFFHISRDDSLAQKTLEPRIPSYLVNDKTQVDTNEELGLHEDATTPRVCFSPSIEGCLNAIVNHGDRIHLAGQAFYVYIPTKPIDQYKHKLNKKLIRDKDVFDAESTGEIWILEPVDVRLYGVIVVDQVSRMKRVPISDKETGNYVYHYTYKWHWLNKPRTLQEGSILKKKKPSRFFLEEDEEEITVGDIELEDSGDNDGDSDDKESKQDSDTIETTVSEKTEMDDDMGSDEESVDEHLDVKNVDLGSFGSDTSDVQNEYDPKEVELLMKLMSSEADAMAEYMDGAKETNVDVLRRLYADIANEERFHMEQLLYAKCELTGETYIPKDPDVKKEYEELLEMGMDEETAMQTAVDKCHINGVVIQSENEQLEEDTELQEDIETMESAMLQFNMTFDYMMEMAENSRFSAQDFYDTLDVFTEACINTDDVVMEAQQVGYVRQKKGPISVLKNAISFLLGLIGKLISKFGELLKRLGNRGHRILAYIKRYGIKGILATNTISMYFYDMMDPTNASNTVAYFWTLVYDVYREAVKTLGIQAPTVPDETGLLRSSRLKVTSLDDGVNKLNGVELVKTKSVLPDDPEKQAQVITYLLGYSKTKLPDGKSANIMNMLMTSAEDWKRLMELMKETLGKVDALSNDQNSVYYTNKALYNKSEEALKVCVKSCKAFVNALTHDVNVLADLNKRLTGALANMKERTTELDIQDATKAQAAQQAQAQQSAPTGTEPKPTDAAAANSGGTQPATQKQQPQSGTAARKLKPQDQHKLDQFVEERNELGLTEWLKSLLKQAATLTGGKK